MVSIGKYLQPLASLVKDVVHEKPHAVSRFAHQVSQARAQSAPHPDAQRSRDRAMKWMLALPHRPDVRAFFGRLRDKDLGPSPYESLYVSRHPPAPSSYQDQPTQLYSSGQTAYPTPGLQPYACFPVKPDAYVHQPVQQAVQPARPAGQAQTPALPLSPTVPDHRPGGAAASLHAPALTSASTSASTLPVAVSSIQEGQPAPGKRPVAPLATTTQKTPSYAPPKRAKVSFDPVPQDDIHLEEHADAAFAPAKKQPPSPKTRPLKSALKSSLKPAPAGAQVTGNPAASAAGTGAANASETTVATGTAGENAPVTGRLAVSAKDAVEQLAKTALAQGSVQKTAAPLAFTASDLRACLDKRSLAGNPENLRKVGDAFQSLFQMSARHPAFQQRYDGAATNSFTSAADSQHLMLRMRSHRGQRELPSDGTPVLLGDGIYRQHSNAMSTMFVQTLQINGQTYHAVLDGHQDASAQAFIGRIGDGKTRVQWQMDLVRERDMRYLPEAE